MPYAMNGETRIYWDESGVGNPVLLIMGLGYSLDMWHRTRPVLAQRYRTIAFDNRGIGRSDTTPGPYSIALMASDAAAVLDAAGVSQARVIGVSMGGMIAQEFVLRYPQRVERLVLGCTSCGGANAVPGTPEALRVLTARADMPPEEACRAAVPYIYDASTPRERIEEDLALRLRHFPSREGYLAQLQGILAWSSYSRLDQIRTRVLVIHGETDPLIPAENARILAGRIPGAKLVLIASASHIFTTDQPAASHAAMLEFLQ